MFRRLTIELTEPICQCPVQNLTWQVFSSRGSEQDTRLQVSCKTCGTALCVPNNHFKAAFQLDKPYPGLQEVPKPKMEGKLIPLDGGKAD